MRFLAPLALCLAACSSDPVAAPSDAMTDTTLLGPDACELAVMHGGDPCLCADGGTGRRIICDPPGACICGSDAGADAPSADALPDAQGDAALPPDAPADADERDATIDGQAADAATDAVVDTAPTCDVRCDGGCVDTDFDPLNCGGCGMVCHSSAAHVSPRCFAARCEFPCATGYGDCDGNAVNGCETFVMGTDPNNCGGCRAHCQTTETCMAGICRSVH